MADGLIAAVAQKGVVDQDNTTVVAVRIDAADDDADPACVARPKGEEVDLRTRRIGVSRRGTAPRARRWEGTRGRMARGRRRAGVLRRRPHARRAVVAPDDVLHSGVHRRSPGRADNGTGQCSGRAPCGWSRLGQTGCRQSHGPQDTGRPQVGCRAAAQTTPSAPPPFARPAQWLRQRPGRGRAAGSTEQIRGNAAARLLPAAAWPNEEGGATSPAPPAVGEEGAGTRTSAPAAPSRPQAAPSAEGRVPGGLAWQAQPRRECRAPAQGAGAQQGEIACAYSRAAAGGAEGDLRHQDYDGPISSTIE